ncbi:hypothetical protein ACK83U_12405 [Rhizobium sp. WW22]|uniref:hypothetical protein n=1 Tax=Rhizobium sp. WW22 TaxID=3389070 RepID=UPI000DD7C3FB
MSQTSLRLRVVPRYPAKVTATDGLKAVRTGVDLVVKSDYSNLVQVPSVSNPDRTFMLAWDADIDNYQSMSFTNIINNIQDAVIGPPLAAIDATNPGANQVVYFTDVGVASTYTASDFVRGISNSADGASFSAAIGALNSSDIGNTVPVIQSQYAYVYDKDILLQNIPNIDLSGATDSSTALLALQNAHASTGFKFRVPRDGKIRLDQSFVVNQGQILRGDLTPNDASGIAGYDYSMLPYAFVLGSGAQFRLDNGGIIENLLIYRRGLVFNADQGNFSSWTGNGIVLGYGNDQNVRNTMVLGFQYGVRSLNDRGLNGSGRVVLDKVYVDCVNGFYLNGSYDTAYFDRLKAFGFVTQGYAGTPAPGEGYDPRKDRRPGVGFQMLDRSDGTTLASLHVFGYKTGFRANTASWLAANVSIDYPTTPTYTSAGLGVLGVELLADTDPTGPRFTDYDPSQIANLQIWSVENGLKITGSAGRITQIGTLAIVNPYGDGIQINGGGLICQNVRMANVSGAPVRFLKAPDTRSLIRGYASNFGAGRNSSGVPVVKVPANSNVNLVDVRLDSDQSVGASYFDNHPKAQQVASADPLLLPAYRGGDVEEYLVTGTTGFSGMYGLRPARILLRFQSALTIFAGPFTGGFRLPGAATSLSVAAGASILFEYDGDLDRWRAVAYSG